MLVEVFPQATKHPVKFSESCEAFKDHTQMEIENSQRQRHICPADDGMPRRKNFYSLSGPASGSAFLR